jgi:DNA-binding Xre family transcriptional regulator
LIDDLAARRGITIKELAASAGIARDTFYKIHDPKLSILKGLADALGIPVSRLASRVAAVESETA